MHKAYENRLNASTYRDDVQCQLRLQSHPRDEGRAPMVSWISEKLLARLRHLALAYDLPLLARLPSDGSIIYPEVQLVSVEDELAFLFEVVSDQVLLAAIAPMREMIQRAQHDPRGWSLVVEAPWLSTSCPTRRCRRTNTSFASLPPLFAAECQNRWADRDEQEGDWIAR
jgi:hypothetical protein